MKKRYHQFVPSFISILAAAILVFFSTTLALSWTILVTLLLLAGAMYSLWLAKTSGNTVAGKDEDIGKKKIPLQDLSTLLEYNDAIISILNAEMHTLFRSPAAARITGWPDAEFSKRSVAEHCHPEDCSLFSEVFRQAMEQPDVPQHISFRLQHKQGHYIWLEGWITNMLKRPVVQGVVTNLRDVTALKQMAGETEKSRRFYKFISEVNHMIVQAGTEEQLFTEACRIAVVTGGYRYAFVALSDSGELKLHSYAGSPDAGSASTGIALLRSCQQAAADVMKRKLCYIQQTDEDGGPATAIKDKAGTRGNDLSSVILLPVSVADRPEGIVGIWSAAGNTFDEEEVRLLEEMAADISYSLSHLRSEALRLKTQNELQDSERRYQVLAESAPVGIFHTDETGYTTYVNPRWKEISGMKESSALGDDWLAAVHPEDRLKLKRGWENATHEHQSSSTSEYRFLKKDGSVVYVLGLAVAQTDSEGNVTGYIGTIIDITERKKAEEENLRLLKEVLNEKTLSDSVINSLPGIFYLYDRHNHFIRWNENFSRVSGYPYEKIREMSPLDFFSEDEKELIREKIERTFLHGEEAVQADFVTANGTRIPYYFTGKMIRYKGEDCLVGVGFDFTERLNAQQKIRETTDQLRSLAAHLQEVREEERKGIGREIHDELGQTLTAIKMDIAWINKRIADDEVLKEKLKNVSALLDRSNLSVRKILTQLRPGIFQSGSLLDAIRWLMRQFRETSGIEAEFSCNAEEVDLPDNITTSIFRVLQEALTNITRYAKAQHVKVQLRIESSSVSLFIGDDGTGFDINSVNPHKSFGILGMKERVISLRGTFELKSEKGRGTEIYIIIPAGYEHQTDLPDRPQSAT